LYKKAVIETLRFDPPVHNTRRIAIKDIQVGDQIIKEGQKILIVMAAANFDPQIFKNPEIYDHTRTNNEANLTFGLGGHMCLAKHLTIDMAARTCVFLTNKYRKINILQQEFRYEPQTNVRLIKQLIIGLS
jgi:cytochrome P450